MGTNFKDEEMFASEEVSILWIIAIHKVPYFSLSIDALF